MVVILIFSFQKFYSGLVSKYFNLSWIINKTTSCMFRENNESYNTKVILTRWYSAFILPNLSYIYCQPMHQKRIADIPITFLVVHNENSWSTSSFCEICLGCEFAVPSIHHYYFSSKLIRPNQSITWTLAAINIFSALAWLCIISKSVWYEKTKTLFFVGLQQSRGSESDRRIWFAFFSFDTMLVPNHTPTPTNSAFSMPSTQVWTFTYHKQCLIYGQENG